MAEQAAPIQDYVNNELVKNKICTLYKQVFNTAPLDQEIDEIMYALEAVFEQLGNIDRECKDSLESKFYGSVFFLMDTLMAQMIAVKVGQRTKGE